MNKIFPKIKKNYIETFGSNNKDLSESDISDFIKSEINSHGFKPMNTFCSAHILCCQFLDIDEKLDKRDLYMVKISDAGAGDEYGIEDIPSLVYFEDGVPEIFTGQSCEVGVL